MSFECYQALEYVSADNMDSAIDFFYCKLRIIDTCKKIPLCGIVVSKYDLGCDNIILLGFNIKYFFPDKFFKIYSLNKNITYISILSLSDKLFPKDFCCPKPNIIHNIKKLDSISQTIETEIIKIKKCSVYQKNKSCKPNCAPDLFLNKHKNFINTDTDDYKQIFIDTDSYPIKCSNNKRKLRDKSSSSNMFEKCDSIKHKSKKKLTPIDKLHELKYYDNVYKIRHQCKSIDEELCDLQKDIKEKYVETKNKLKCGETNSIKIFIRYTEKLFRKLKYKYGESLASSLLSILAILTD